MFHIYPFLIKPIVLETIVIILTEIIAELAITPILAVNHITVKTIITLCKNLNVIADAVEQKNFMTENGCDFIQEYYYSRPLVYKRYDSVY